MVSVLVPSPCFLGFVVLTPLQNGGKFHLHSHLLLLFSSIILGWYLTIVHLILQKYLHVVSTTKERVEGGAKWRNWEVSQEGNVGGKKKKKSSLKHFSISPCGSWTLVLTIQWVSTSASNHSVMVRLKDNIHPSLCPGKHFFACY